MLCRVVVKSKISPNSTTTALYLSRELYTVQLKFNRTPVWIADRSRWFLEIGCEREKLRRQRVPAHQKTSSKNHLLTKAIVWIHLHCKGSEF